MLYNWIVGKAIDFKAIGNRIRSVRESRGYTQSDLAHEVGLTQPAIGKIESGKSKVELENLYNLANALGCSVAYLLGVGTDKLTANEDDLLETYRSAPDGTKAMILVALQAWVRLTPAEPDQSLLKLSDAPEIELPSDEHVMEVLKRLSTHRQRQVYDFARWQLREQYNPLSSNRKRDREAKKKEWQEVIDLIDLMLAIEEATPEERENFIAYLTEQYRTQQADYSSESGKLPSLSVDQ